MSINTPDRWVVVEIEFENESIRKVLASWYGGFAGSDEWRLSSGIVESTEFDDRWEFLNQSGSLYICRKGSQGMSGYTAGIYAGFQKKFENNGSIKIVEL
jgi:hypothetical protein